MASKIDAQTIKETLAKVPVALVALAYLAYLGWGAYKLHTSEDSPLVMKQAQIQEIEAEKQALETKVRSANEFFKSLDLKRNELRVLASKLDGMKGTLSTEVDIPNFIKMVVTEAKRIGMTVASIQPARASNGEYYREQPFEMNFRGVYVQLVVFLDRMANAKSIVRVDDFEMRPVRSGTGQFVELEGTIRLKAYSYLGTKADEVAASSTKPVSAPQAAREGGT